MPYDDPMNETTRIRDQLERSHRGPAWHGPSLLENLEGVTAAVAARRKVPGAHSIWEIVRHVTVWEAEVARVIDGKEYVSLQGDAEWPPLTDTGDAAWKTALEELDGANAALCDAVTRFREDRLNEKVAQRDFSFYGLMHGVVQHNLYHAGQIGLLRK